MSLTVAQPEQPYCFSSFIDSGEVGFDREVELVNLEFAKREKQWLTRFVFDVDGESLTIFIRDDKKLDQFEEDSSYHVLVTKSGTFIGEEFFPIQFVTVCTSN